MAGAGHEIAAGAGGRGHLRASHADREQVIETLKIAFVQGRFDRDEFDVRVGQAFASRTYAELAASIADLPAGLTRLQPPVPGRVQSRQPGWRPGRVAAAATVLYAGVWVYAIVFPSGGDRDTDGVLVFLAGFVYLIILAICVGRQPLCGRSAPMGSHRGGRQRVRAVRQPSAYDRPTRAGSFPPPVMATSTPPKPCGGVFSALAIPIR